jgi:predicted Zn-dependent protease
VPQALLRRPRTLASLGVLLALLALGSALLGRRLWARHELQVGQALLARYLPDAARPHLEACLRLSPGNAQAVLLLARGARRANMLDAAEQYLADYERLAGHTDELEQEQIFQAAARGEVDRVVKYCRSLLDQDSPAATLAMEAMVQGYFRMYRLGEGSAVLEVWLGREPDNTQALLFQAGLRAMMQHIDDAVPLYKRILELDPEQDTARGRLAELLVEQRKAQEAAPHLRLLRPRHPGKPLVAVLLARCHDELGRPDEAEELLDEVLALHPHFVPALTERGILALRQGQEARAEECLREALRQHPGDRKARYQLLQCLYQREKWAEAEVERARYEAVERQYKRLHVIVAGGEIRRRSRDPAFHYELFLLFLTVGQTEDAAVLLKHALKEDPRYAPAAHQALADYFERAGDEAAAAHHRRFLPAPNAASMNQSGSRPTP